MVSETFVLELVLFVALPGIGGPLIAHGAGLWAYRRGATPARVRGIKVAITIAWIALLAAGLTTTLGSASFLSTLTFSAIAGVAITLALQTTLQNLVAGLVLLQHREVRVGDQIQFSGVKGHVVSVGLVSTVIKMDDGNLAFVSNSNLLSGPLVNLTAASRFVGEY